jgi:hypothetical protein
VAVVIADLGTRFVTALAAKNTDALRALFAEEVDFRAMTPGRFWEAATPSGVVEVLYQWFEASDVVESVEHLECAGIIDRNRVDYRYRVRNPDGLHLVEQRAYFDVDGAGRICRMNTMCSGYRPIATS